MSSGVDATEASQCQGDYVCIVGGADSAALAAPNVARFTQQVVPVVRTVTV